MVVTNNNLILFYLVALQVILANKHGPLIDAFTSRVNLSSDKLPLSRYAVGNLAACDHALPSYFRIDMLEDPCII
jgi:hypothetical protein